MVSETHFIIQVLEKHCLTAVDPWMRTLALKLFIETIDSIDYAETEYTEAGFPVYASYHTKYDLRN